ncbi:hypothetical protein ACFX13_017329 [Malus domestica]
MRLDLQEKPGYVGKNGFRSNLEKAKSFSSLMVSNERNSQALSSFPARKNSVHQWHEKARLDSEENSDVERKTEVQKYLKAKKKSNGMASSSCPSSSTALVR